MLHFLRFKIFGNSSYLKKCCIKWRVIFNAKTKNKKTKDFKILFSENPLCPFPLYNQILNLFGIHSRITIIFLRSHSCPKFWKKFCKMSSNSIKIIYIDISFAILSWIFIWFIIRWINIWGIIFKRT